MVLLLLLLLALLQDVDKMRHAVGLKAYSSQQPLDEFRLEANRAFLLLLDTYRDAVAARLMVPDLNFSLLLGQQEEGLVQEAMADVQQQRPQEQQQPGSNGQQAPQQQWPGAAAAPASSAAAGYANGSSPQRHSQPEQGLQPAATSAGKPSSS